jgi:hypothetical protein
VGCSSGKTSWSNVRYAQSQKIEKPNNIKAKKGAEILLSLWEAKKVSSLLF